MGVESKLMSHPKKPLFLNPWRSVLVKEPKLLQYVSDVCIYVWYLWKLHLTVVRRAQKDGSEIHAEAHVASRGVAEGHFWMA